MAEQRSTHTKRQHVEYQEDIPDIDQGLNDLAKETTVRDLMRRGQHKKLRTIRERDLKEWIATALRRVMVTHEDTFTDEQKEEMVAKVQAEMQQRIQTLQEQAKAAEAGAQEWRNQYQKAVDEAGENQQLHDVLANLQAKYENAQAEREDAVARLLEMEDDFNENKSMLATTIAEKERLQTTNRELFMRSGQLIEPILSIDTEFYHGSHQEETPGEAEDDSSFFRDFEVSTHVLETLQGDLAKGGAGAFAQASASAAGEPVVAETGAPDQPEVLREEHLLTLYEASDQALAKLSGMLDVESAEELEDQAGDDQSLIVSEPIAKLHHKIILLGKGISLQSDRLQHLEEENASLRTQQDELAINGQGRAVARRIAETLAAAAIPLNREAAANDVDAELQQCAAALEEALAEDSEDLEAVQERADAVIATMVAERQRMGSSLTDQQRRAAAAEDALRKLAGAAAAAVCEEGKEDDSDLGTATDNLRKGLDTPADLVPGGNEQLLADISVDGAQVIAQLREERDAAQQQAAAVRASERALAARLLELAVDSDDDAVMGVAMALRQAMDNDPEAPVSDHIKATTEALAQHGTSVANEQGASAAELEEVRQRLAAAEQAANEHENTINELREHNAALQEQLDQRDSELAELETRVAEDDEQLGTLQEDLRAAKDHVTTLQAGQEGVAEALSQLAKEHQQAMADLEQDGEEDDALVAAADQVEELVTAEGEHDPDRMLDATRGVIARLRVANDALAQRLRRKEQELGDVRRSTASEAESLDELKKALANAESEREQSKQDATALQDQVATLNQRIDAAAEDALAKDEELEQLRAQAEDAAARLASNEQTVQELNQRIDAAAEDALAKDEELEQLREQEEKARQQLAENEQTVQDLNRRIEAAAEDLLAKEDELEQLRAANQEAAEQVQALAQLREQLAENETALNTSQEERNKAQEDLTKAQDNLASKEGEVAEQAAELEQLRPLQQRCGELQQQVEATTQAQTALQEENETQRLRIDEMESECAQLRNERNQLQELRDDLKRQLEAALQQGAQAEELQHSLGQSSQRLEQLEVDLAEREKALAESQQVLEHSQQQLSERDEQLAESTTALQEHEAALAEAQARIAAADEATGSLQQTLQERDDQITELQQRIDEQELRINELQALKGELAEAQQEHSATSERCQQLEQLLAERDERIASLDGDVAQAQEREQLLNDQLEALRSELDHLRRSLRNAEARISELEAREEQLEADFEKDIAALRQQLDDEENAHAAVRQRLDTYEEDHAETLASLRGRLQDAESVRGRLEQEVQQQGDELTTIRQHHEHDTNRLQRLDEELAALQLQRDELRQQLRQVEHDLEEERNTRCGWEARKERLEQDHKEQIKGLRERLQKARDELHSMQSEARHLREDNVGLRSRLRVHEAADNDDEGHDDRVN